MQQEGTSSMFTLENQLQPPVSTVDIESPSIVDMLRVFQSSMDKQLSSVCNKLEYIDTRMVLLESRQKTLEEEVRSSASCSSSANCSPVAPLPKRKRAIPLTLQVCF